MLRQVGIIGLEVGEESQVKSEVFRCTSGRFMNQNLTSLINRIISIISIPVTKRIELSTTIIYTIKECT